MVVALALTGAVGPAAAAQRTFVASDGNDANACSLIAPCRTFQAAVNLVDSAGEVVALDSGGFGTVSISKSVTIRVPRGIVGSITAPAGNDGVVVAGTAIVVRLVGLTITSNSQSGNGIRLLQGSELSVEGCSTEGFDIGILNEAPGGRLGVQDTTIRGAHNGVKVQTASGNALGRLDRVRVENHTAHGIYAGGNSTLTARDTVVVGRGTSFGDSYSGFVALGTPAGAALLIVEGSMVSETACGICAGPVNTGGPTKVVVSNSTSVHNDRGAESFGGSGGTNTILTFGNNRITENGSCNGDCFDGTVGIH